jgi:hypothetical protein
MRIPVNITGGTYESPAVQLSAQLTRNWYPEIQKDGSYTLMPWYGYTSFSSDQSGSDRGMLFHRGVLYKVTGISLYSVNSNGVSTSLGTIQGSRPVVMQGFGKNVLIATGEGRVYEYDTSTVNELTDVDFQSPTWVAVLKNFAIYGGDEDQFVVSAFSDASDVNALDYARAETAADDLVRGEAFGEELYLFGTRTLERWFVSGVGRPPLAFRDSAPIGIASRMSVAKNDQFMYWLSDDRKIYRVPGLQPVQNIGIAHVFDNYTTVDDAIGFCCTKDGQNFYHLTFPTENATWLYCETVNEWVNLSSQTSEGRDIAQSYAYAYGRHLVGDYSGSNIYEWGDGYTENSAEIERERITLPLDGKLLGAPGRDIELNRFELFAEMGVGNINEVDPQICLQVSTNRGRTFNTERWASIGRSGEFENRVIWNNLGRAQSFVFKIKAADNAQFVIRDAAVDFEVGI